MAFDEEILRRVWDKGEAASNVDPDIWRKDACGAWMRRDFYGDEESQFGWEIDCVVPESEGGPRDLSNLRPLQWENKMARRGRHLACPITAVGKYNVPKRRRHRRPPAASGGLRAASSRHGASESERARAT